MYHTGAGNQNLAFCASRPADPNLILSKGIAKNVLVSRYH